jgi:hypothetical protein
MLLTPIEVYIYLIKEAKKMIDFPSHLKFVLLTNIVAFDIPMSLKDNKCRVALSQIFNSILVKSIIKSKRISVINDFVLKVHLHGSEETLRDFLKRFVGELLGVEIVSNTSKTSTEEVVLKRGIQDLCLKTSIFSFYETYLISVFGKERAEYMLSFHGELILNPEGSSNVDEYGIRRKMGYYGLNAYILESLFKKEMISEADLNEERESLSLTSEPAHLWFLDYVLKTRPQEKEKFESYIPYIEEDEESFFDFNVFSQNEFC